MTKTWGLFFYLWSVVLRWWQKPFDVYQLQTWHIQSICIYWAILQQTSATRQPCTSHLSSP